MIARRLDAEDGFSLAEILVTVVIVGVTFTALLGGLATAITVSDYHRKEATADSLARDAAEWVKDPVSTTYVPCAGTGAYSLAGIATSSDYTVAVTSVDYWDGVLPSSSTYTYSPAYAGNCITDQGLQRITITASSADGRAVETVQVTKRVAT